MKLEDGQHNQCRLRMKMVLAKPSSRSKCSKKSGALLRRTKKLIKLSTFLTIARAFVEAVSSHLWRELPSMCSSIGNLTLFDIDKAQSVDLGGLGLLMKLHIDNLERLTLGVTCTVQSTPEGPDQMFRQLCLSDNHKPMPLTTLHIDHITGKHLSLASLRHISGHLLHLLDFKLPIDSSLACEAPDGLFVRGSAPLSRLTP